MRRAMFGALAGKLLCARVPAIRTHHKPNRAQLCDLRHDTHALCIRIVPLGVEPSTSKFGDADSMRGSVPEEAARLRNFVASFHVRGACRRDHATAGGRHRLARRPHLCSLHKDGFPIGPPNSASRWRSSTHLSPPRPTQDRCARDIHSDASSVSRF